MGHTETDTRIHILEEAMPLFAAKGYNGVSMRHLARAVNLSSAALYHHFPDKHTLYLEVMKHSFVDKAHDIMRSGDEASDPVERFEAFIKRLTQVVTEDQIFRALVMWELLDGDEARLKLVAEEVLLEPFKCVYALIKEMAPDVDHYMHSLSCIWLVLSHSAAAPMCQFLPGWNDSYSAPDVISKHAIQLLGQGVHKGV